MILRLATLTSLFGALATTYVAAAECNLYGVDKDQLNDRDLFYRLSGTIGPWSRADNSPLALTGRPLDLAYVSKEFFGSKHSGVLVIKSGRYITAEDPRQGLKEKQIRLERERALYCDEFSGYSGKVSAQTYDEYHDQGKNSDLDELKQLQSFHVKYRGRGSCKVTDEHAADAKSLRNNRGQFSFDPEVVSTGTYSQLFALIGATTASATSEKYLDQRVEIKKYDTIARMANCVMMQLPPLKRGAFVRINDLEGLNPNDLTLRGDEKEWQLAPK
jgi:hypothetical protein